MIKTGIVTANYNNAKNLEDWLEGIKKQIKKPDYVCFADDQSTDGSVQRLKELLGGMGKDEDNCKKWGIHFQIIIMDVNGGPAPARNACVKWLSDNTDSQIAFVYDSDDRYYPEKISMTCSLFERYPFTGLIYSDYDMIYDDGSPSQREFKEPFCLDRLTDECIVSNNSAYSIRLFNEIGGYDNNIFGAEDFDLWIRMGERCSILHIAEPLYAYRIGEGNITVATDKEKFAKEVRKVYEKTYLRRQNAHH